MAKKRDVIIGIIIVAVVMVSLVFFGLMFIGLLSSEGDLEFTGLGGNIGVVELFGVIDEVSGREAIKYIERLADNGSVKAIVLHINSPGGGVAITQEVYDAVRRAKEEKPVVASMASVAASGGYYVACACDRIVANPGTLTGSIGVIFEFHTFRGLMDKVGVSTEVVKSGELKDVGSYSRPMTDDERRMLESVVGDSYEQFVEAVAEGRGRTPDDIYVLADGSVFTGRQALNYGLVDTLGGLNEAVELAAQLAELSGEPKVVKPYEKKKVGLFDLLGGVSNLLNQPMETAFPGPQLMYLYR